MLSGQLYVLAALDLGKCFVMPMGKEVWWDLDAAWTWWRRQSLPLSCGCLANNKRVTLLTGPSWLIWTCALLDTWSVIRSVLHCQSSPSFFDTQSCNTNT